MDYRITLHKAWRTDRKLIHPGRYRIPEDMSDALAKRALVQADATKMEPKVEPVNAPPSTDGNPQTNEQPQARGRKKKARGRAPENKSALGR